MTCRMPCAPRCPTSPTLMTESDRRARAAERACADATEAAVLHGREGEQFRAVVVDHTDKGMAVQLVDLPVLARVTGERAALGDEVAARLESADVHRRCRGVRADLTASLTPPLAPTLVADESGGRSRRWETTAEEGPGSEGQDGGQQPPGVTRGTVPQRTDRPGRASERGKGETVV